MAAYYTGPNLSTERELCPVAQCVSSSHRRRGVNEMGGGTDGGGHPTQPLCNPFITSPIFGNATYRCVRIH